MTCGYAIFAYMYNGNPPKLDDFVLRICSFYKLGVTRIEPIHVIL